MMTVAATVAAMMGNAELLEPLLHDFQGLVVVGQCRFVLLQPVACCAAVRVNMGLVTRVILVQVLDRARKVAYRTLVLAPLLPKATAGEVGHLPFSP